MNNEIKEILEFKENADYKKLSCDEIKVLRDYIINLQQFNLSLAKENEQEKQFIKDCGFENGQQLVLDYIGIRQEKEDYKSRIEKAVDYIKELISATKGTLNDMNYCDKKETITQYVENLEYDINHYEYLLNILNGKE